jgi:2-polyprenyl-3-methyl-5-hydroxy-6-metoxy-1,4-benzoquinol methylase
MASHRRDISSHDLDAMLALTPHREALRELVACGRERIGFFPAHNPRALEYPWVLANMPPQLANVRILDVGAGVNPLPFVLAQRGACVVTMDNHPLLRDPRQREEWNEWGFLDYSQVDARIASLHLAYEDSPDSMGFDCVYSVSVIEHLPGTVRRAWASKFAAQLPKGGDLLLTVDIIPDTNLLWNLSEGSVVEPTGAHGEFSTLLDELWDAGFIVDHDGIQREIADSRVDIGFIRAVRR